MKLNKLFFGAIAMFLLISIVLPLSSAWGPNTHNYLSRDELMDQTEIGTICSTTEANKAAYLLGVEVPDLTVIYYYEQGGREYRISHNWLFQQEIMNQALTDDEKCLAWGIAAHLIEDGISHTQSVPEAITKFRMPNWIVHPLLEKKIDSALILKYPDLGSTTPHMMDALDGPNSARYISMIESAMGSNSVIDVKSELTKLKIAISGNKFYDTQFKPTGSTWIFQGYYYIDKFTNFLGPYIGTVNFENADAYLDKTEEQTKNTFDNWGSRYKLSPHGFDELSAANEKTNSSLTIIFILAFGIPILLTIRSKNPKWKYKYLLLIPVLLLAVIVGVYALL